MSRRLALLVCLLLAAGCFRSSYNLSTQRQEYSLTSTDKEVNMGRKIARQVKKEMPVVQDEEVQARVRAIGQKLAAVCGRQELLYEFTVIEDKEVNAFSLPGGFIFVNTGLVDAVDSDDELAAVIGHEIAHVAARHSIKRYESSLGQQLLQIASIAAARKGGVPVGGMQVAAQAARLAYARQDELEADQLAVGYLKAAGYDPKAILSFLDKLHDIHRNKDELQYLPRGFTRPQYAMTHPYVADRIRAVKEALYGVADYIDYLNARN